MCTKKDKIENNLLIDVNFSGTSISFLLFSLEGNGECACGELETRRFLVAT